MKLRKHGDGCDYDESSLSINRSRPFVREVETVSLSTRNETASDLQYICQAKLVLGGKNTEKLLSRSLAKPPPLPCQIWSCLMLAMFGETSANLFITVNH